MFNVDSVQSIFLSSWKVRLGDSLNWAQPAYDDTRWQSLAETGLPIHDRGIFWLRTKIRLVESSGNDRPVFRVRLLQSAFEVYWDGSQIGMNGRVGTDKEEEKPGNLQYALALPPAGRGQSTHVLSLRCSNFHVSVPSGLLMATSLETVHATSILSPATFLRVSLLVGIGLAGGILGLTLYFAGGRFRSYLYSSFLCFALVFSKSMEVLANLWNIPMSFMNTFDVLYVAGFYIAEISVLVFFLFSFDLPRRTVQVAAIILLSIPFYVGNVHESQAFHYLNYDVFRVAISPYFYAVLFLAVKRKKTGSIVAAVAYVFYSIPPILLILGFTSPSLVFDTVRAVLILIPIVVSGRQVHEQQEREKEMEQESRRVRTELLAKTIQPHFLFNSLASVKSLARNNPRKADRLVEALTAEFRLLNHVMAEKEIPLTQEIELCNHHLRVMGIRRAATYTLVIGDLPVNETIPPLILHTLIENGLTHAFRPKEKGCFWLTVQRSDGVIEYRLENNGSQVAQQSSDSIEEGMGLKYIRTRLEERYPGKWDLRYGVNGGKWEVRITIPRRFSR
jgi:hypothetical protein